MEVLTALLVILISVIAVFVYMANKTNQYWKEKGIPHKKPVLFFGNAFKAILGFGGDIVSISRNEVYQMFPDEPVVGYYDFMRPALIIKDIELVQRILIKDFAHFNTRFVEIDEDKFPQLVNLSNMAGKRWKSLRNKMIPVFTTGKLRLMYDQMSELSDIMMNHLNPNKVKHVKSVGLKEFFNCYSMDIIGSTAFGIHIGSLRDKDNEFARMGKKVFDWVFTLKFLLLYNFPKICKQLGVSMNRQSVVDYFSDIVKKTLDHRKSSVASRNDFINLMLTLREKGVLDVSKGDEGADDYLEMTDDSIPATENMEITDDVILGNAFLFIMAGFDTLGTVLDLFCLDLAQNVDIQNKLREEIKRVYLAKGRVFSYDVIRDVNYLEMCVKETMRLHPIVGMISRSCTKEYTIPGTGITLQPGDFVEVPTYSIHMDPEYYPSPEKFDPERFAADVSRPSCTWLPFGEGPRICIAMRFVMTEIKCAMAKLLLNYEINLNPKTELPLRPRPRAILYAPQQSIYYDLKKIEL